MTETMANTIEKQIKKKSVIIGNFIDEKSIEKYRKIKKENSNTFKIVFIGRLYYGKKPDLVIKTISKIIDNYKINLSLLIIGTGPLKKKLEKEVVQLQKNKFIKFLGHLNDPWVEAFDANLLVLPSKSEGLSRAVLEALYLGIPCLVRNVDSNKDLIEPGKNGFLFDNDKYFFNQTLEAIQFFSTIKLKKKILLKNIFREKFCIDQYSKLIEKI